MTAIKPPHQSSIGGRHFDQVARSYDAVRMSYPAALFDDMFDYAGLPAVKRALEIGCGSGQATKSVAPRGITIVCVEPGPNLAELAQKNLAAFRNVRVVRSSFEEWTLDPEPFDLVFSANAIHWVNRRVRTGKTARALRPDGTLAIFRNIPVRKHSAVEREIDAIMGGVAASEEEPSRLPKESDFHRSGYFEGFCKHRYEGAQLYDADSYADLLFTLQRYHRIPPEVRSERLSKVRAVVRYNGGTIRVNYVTHLLLARKRNRKPWPEEIFSQHENSSSRRLTWTFSVAENSQLAWTVSFRSFIRLQASRYSPIPESARGFESRIRILAVGNPFL